MPTRSFGVVGGGQMGAGIAQVGATVGYNVTIYDSFPGAKERALDGIGKSLAKLTEKGKLTETPDIIKARIQFVDKIDKLAEKNPELVVEAATENFEIKREIFTQLDRALAPDAILASNTSSISITRLAACTRRPEKVCGMHFMNPVPLMTLVELIRGLATADDVFTKIETMSKEMGKTTIVSKDVPGFVVNRILMPMINEACFALAEGLASAADIDAGMKLGTNQPMGPLTLADFIGLDTCLSIMEVLHEGLGESKYRPSPLLRQYVQAGWLGRKTKRGFYKYD